MANISLVLYNFVEDEKQIRHKFEYKNDFKKVFLHKLDRIEATDPECDKTQDERAEKVND